MTKDSASTDSATPARCPTPTNTTQVVEDDRVVESKQVKESEQVVENESALINKRFRNFLPVVVDVETAGLNAQTDALLEIAFVPILMDKTGKLILGEPMNAHIEPFEGANLEASALAFTGIDPNNPMRKLIAEDEKTALRRMFKDLKEVRKQQKCSQCILIGHNAHFDLGFLNSAIARTNSKSHSPFHSFSVLDTVSLSALAFGQTVLAKACQLAEVEFDNNEAHSALYDTIKTAELFCKIINSYPMLANALAEN